MNIVVADCLLS